MRVLVVERERELADLVSTTFEDEGHRVEVVPDRDRALDALAADPTFDVVVSRGFGPLATGVTPDELAQLASLQAKLPVVLYTAHGWAQEMGADALGVAAVIPKPFDLDELVDTVTRAARR